MKQAAKTLPDFDIEIVEMHHRMKRDAPSGTALLLGEAAAQARHIALSEHAAHARETDGAARQNGTIGFASLRGGTVVGEHTVVFAGPHERLQLSHIAEDRMIFANGALAAARWLQGKSPGLYAMTDVLGVDGLARRTPVACGGQRGFERLRERKPLARPQEAPDLYRLAVAAQGQFSRHVRRLLKMHRYPVWVEVHVVRGSTRGMTVDEQFRCREPHLLESARCDTAGMERPGEQKDVGPHERCDGPRAAQHEQDRKCDVDRRDQSEDHGKRARVHRRIWPQNFIQKHGASGLVHGRRLPVFCRSQKRRQPCGEMRSGYVGSMARPFTRKEIETFFARLAAHTPNPKTELAYINPYTLLVAVVLSAQATDRGVNKATAALFKQADAPEKMVRLGEAKLIDFIKTIGLYRNKAKNVIALSKLLIEQHGGAVPRDRESLEALPGVGRKTANVVLNVAFGEPTIAVDTHIFRVANRTGIAPGKTPLEVELGLERTVPQRYRMHAHHWLILHGRYTCIARKPLCPVCVVRDLCRYKDKTREPQLRADSPVTKRRSLRGRATPAGS